MTNSKPMWNQACQSAIMNQSIAPMADCMCAYMIVRDYVNDYVACLDQSAYGFICKSCGA